MANLYPLLPKLKEDSAVTPSKVSSWTSETPDFLDQLIKSLAVPDDTPEFESIDSIPDVWARPLLFEMALFDKQNAAEQQFGTSLFKRVQGEWRCILAMIALNASSTSSDIGISRTPLSVFGSSIIYCILELRIS